jgi:NTP pyrophosphatase (non-canonical NTP hydrolase)
MDNLFCLHGNPTDEYCEKCGLSTRDVLYRTVPPLGLNKWREEQAMFDRAYGLNYSNDKNSVIYVAACICGEAGELVNVIKKWVRGDGPLDVPHTEEELVDVLVYCFKLAATMGIDLDEAYHAKRQILHERWRAKRGITG